MAAANIEEALVAFLLADPLIVALVGARIGPWSAQGDAVPRITYTLIDTQDEGDLWVSSDQPTVRIQLDIWGQTMTQARALAKIVKNSQGGGTGKRLKEFAGNMAGVWIQVIDLENEAYGNVEIPDASGRVEPRVTLDLVIGFKEP